LADQQHGTENAGPSKAGEPPILPLLPWAVAKLERKLQDRRAKREKEPPERRSARITANATRVIAFFALVAALVGFSQAIIADRQLSAMQGQLTALQDQLKVMLVDQRPWVKIQKVEPYIHPISAELSGLRYSGSHEIGFLPLHFVLRNVGHVPAIDVKLGIGEFFGHAEKIDDLATREQTQCAALDNAYSRIPIVVDNADFIRVIFPGDDEPWDSTGLAVRADQIEKFARGEHGKRMFQLWFYGCVRYNLPNSKEPHQTSFAYSVAHIVDAPIPGGKAQTGFTEWEDVPADRILIEPRPLAAGITN
jgi:hypothetical protein